MSRPEGGINDVELGTVTSMSSVSVCPALIPSVWHLMYGSAVRISFLTAVTIVCAIVWQMRRVRAVRVGNSWCTIANCA